MRRRESDTTFLKRPQLIQNKPVGWVLCIKQNKISFFRKLFFKLGFSMYPPPPICLKKTSGVPIFFFVYPTRRCMYCYAVNVASSVHSIGILYGTILGRSATIVGVNGCDGLESGPWYMPPPPTPPALPVSMGFVSIENAPVFWLHSLYHHHSLVRRSSLPLQCYSATVLECRTGQLLGRWALL